MTVIKIKNSNVSGRVPSSGDIEIAELGLNIADKKLYSKDAAGAVFEIGVAGDIPSGIAPPSAGNNVGDLYYDTAVGRLLYWDGSGWQSVVKASGDNFTGNVTLGTDKITLDATDGNITAAGNVVTTGQFQSTSEGNNYIPTVNGQNGGNLDQIYLDAPGGRVFSVKGDGGITAANDVKIGGTSASPNIALGVRTVRASLNSWMFTIRAAATLLSSSLVTLSPLIVLLRLGRISQWPWPGRRLALKTTLSSMLEKTTLLSLESEETEQ